ncbi:MAG: hypothetical protein KF886_23270 [Candidatus Hydrogenedentes bacterium]|nr:hypothetical protein [Candidatus Hydrogenedentota bacterium]
MTGLVLGGLITVSAATNAGNAPALEYGTPLLSEQLREWEWDSGRVVCGSSAITTEQWRMALTQFAGRMLENTVAPDPEFDAIVMEHFWDLA